jgi:hypothetical protein
MNGPEPTPYYATSTTALADGLTAVESIGPEGQIIFWVVAASEPAGPPQPLDASHEEDGKLPPEWRRKLGLECGAATRAGGPCRVLVKTFGARCASHRGKSAQREKAQRAAPRDDGHGVLF